MKAKTEDEFKNQLFKEKPHLIMVGDYNGMSQETQFACLKCGNVWYTKPKNLIYGRSVVGCPKCGRRNISNSQYKTHETFIDEVKESSPTISIIGEYSGAKDYIEAKCKICNYTWHVRADVLLRGVKCPECDAERRAKQMTLTQDEFVKKCHEAGANVTILGEYKGQHQRILVKCNICGLEYYTHPNSVIKGHGCAICNGSKGEQKISSFLTSHSIFYEPQYKFEKCRYKYRLPFDFYLPAYNMCIEYDGIQHFIPIDYFGGENEFVNCKIRDQIKTLFCKNNNIDLIRISYYEFDQIDEILSSILF